MSDQKESPALARLPTTAQSSGLFSPEIKKLQEQSLSTDVQVVPLVLEQNGCKLAIDWFNNDTVKQCRYYNEDKNLIVDLFQDQRGNLKISMHNSAVWQSPQDSNIPRFSKTVAYAISAAGCKVKYKQEALSKYQKGGLND